ncbi:hypothetical protein [Gimesia sp.]|uniref:hypothetical protein n=1 Tax=Gimesia sp. TaxID=2024833 RepID=UPI0032EF5E66
MKLTDSRKAKLITHKILEFAEIGGMDAEHCGMAFEAVENCLDQICIEEGNEDTMSNLIEQIQQILSAEEWKQTVDTETEE